MRTDQGLRSERLVNQRLAAPVVQTSSELVQWLGAVQAQDYAAAKWALGLRLAGSVEADIEISLDEGQLLRTHVMRPTWHIVAQSDIRWMLTLTAPRVHALNAYQYRKLELDDALFARSNTVLVKALEGGQHLTRKELTARLRQAGIDSEDLLRFTYIMMHAELDGLVCSGPKRGKQFTYGLLAERAPQAKTLERDAALAELTRRYFTSHGPATLKDFVWWSGLTTDDAKTGLELVAGQLDHEKIGEATYWFAAGTEPIRELPSTVHLLPNYDEYLVGYTDRSALAHPHHAETIDPKSAVFLGYTLLINGQLVGTWRRTVHQSKVIVELKPFATFSADPAEAFSATLKRYEEFLGMSVMLA